MEDFRKQNKVLIDSIALIRTYIAGIDTNQKSITKKRLRKPLEGIEAVINMDADPAKNFEALHAILSHT